MFVNGAKLITTGLLILSPCHLHDSMYWSIDWLIKNRPLSSSLIFSGVRLGADSQFSDFLDGLGPAQLVGRQTLATPAIGDRRNPPISHVHTSAMIAY